MVFYFFYFNTTLTYFLTPHFSNFLCDKCSVVISKIHYEFIIFLEFIQKNTMIFIKVYDNMNSLKIENVNFEYGFKFYVCI